MPDPEIYVDALTGETRIARLQDGKLLELLIRRPQQGCAVGSIILGRVKKVVASLDGAFVDVGDVQDGFLPIPARTGKPATDEGAAVVVRVRREAMGDKGARLALDDQSLATTNRHTPPALLAIDSDDANSPATWLVTYLESWSKENPPPLVVIDGTDAWNAITTTLPSEQQDVLVRHNTPEPLFEAAGIEPLIDAALCPIVPLPSGGRLHIRETPACITIDVDSGSNSNKQSQGKIRNIRQVNQEAATGIARELRTRNLSGNVVIDFIASPDKKDGTALLDTLRRATATDSAPVDVRGWSRTGMVELVRRRYSASLDEILCQGIPLGDGLGRMKSPLTMAYAALRRAGTEGRKAPGRPVTIKCPVAVYTVLRSSPSSPMADEVSRVKTCLGSPLNITADAAMPLDGLDVYTGA